MASVSDVGDTVRDLIRGCEIILVNFLLAPDMCVWSSSYTSHSQGNSTIRNSPIRRESALLRTDVRIELESERVYLLISTKTLHGYRCAELDPNALLSEPSIPYAVAVCGRTANGDPSHTI